MMRLRWCLAGTALLAAACTGGAGSEASPSSTEPPEPSSTTTTTAVGSSCDPPTPEPPRAQLDRMVTIFVFCGPGVVPIDLRSAQRVVPIADAPLRAAVTQLLGGVTPQESAAGLGSAFSSFTAGQLQEATIKAGIATLDLTAGFVSTNNFSTSNLSAVVMAQIEATVFQFPEITGLEFTVDGERWCGWEATCDEVPTPLRVRP